MYVIAPEPNFRLLPPPGRPKLIKIGLAYHVAIFDDNKVLLQQRSLRTGKYAVAKVRFARMVELLWSGGIPKLPVTAGEALERYWNEHVILKCADVNRQRSALNYLMTFFGKHNLADIDIPLSRKYVDARRAGKAKRPVGWRMVQGGVGADSTIRRELVVLIAAANHARKWRRIREEVMPSIELPMLFRVGGCGLADEAKFFSRGQIALLIFEARGELRQFIKLAYYTGARRASIENLTVRQINFDRTRISLATPGKRPTRKRQPVVPIFNEIEDDLRRLTAAKAPTDRLFRRKHFAVLFQELCWKLRFDEPHHPHMLRHSRATHLLQDGKKIYSVAALLGDTIKTIETHYGHHTADELLKALEPNPKRVEQFQQVVIQFGCETERRTRWPGPKLPDAIMRDVGAAIQVT